jgi:hypothetical protein
VGHSANSWASIRKEDQPICEEAERQCEVGNQTACEAACGRAPRQAFKGFAGPEIERDEVISERSAEVTSVDPIAVAGALVAVGDISWKVIQDGAPVSNLATKQVSVLHTNTNFASYSGWQEMMSKSRRVVELKGLAGKTVISVDMRMIFFHSGKYLNETGRYLKNCYASPSTYVRWGHSLEGQATRAKDPVNVGSLSNPCAQQDIFFSFTYGRPLQKWTDEWRFRYQCDGSWEMSPL